MNPFYDEDKAIYAVFFGEPGKDYAEYAPGGHAAYPRYQVAAFIEYYCGDPEREYLPGFFEGPDALLNARTYAERVATYGGWFDDEDEPQCFVPARRIRSAWVEEITEAHCE